MGDEVTKAELLSALEMGAQRIAFMIRGLRSGHISAANVVLPVGAEIDGSDTPSLEAFLENDMAVIRRLIVKARGESV